MARKQNSEAARQKAEQDAAIEEFRSMTDAALANAQELLVRHLAETLKAKEEAQEKARQLQEEWQRLFFRNSIAAVEIAKREAARRSKG